MADETSFIEWGFKVGVTLALGIGVRLWTRLIDEVRRNERDIATHKLNTAENFVTKKDLSEVRQETHETLTRIHDRIDQIFEILRQAGSRK